MMKWHVNRVVDCCWCWQCDEVAASNDEVQVPCIPGWSHAVHTLLPYFLFYNSRLAFTQ
jgi:hypothetical protein